MDKRSEEIENESVEDFKTFTEKYPNFDFERFLHEEHIDHKVNESGEHLEYSVNCPECLNHGEPTPDTKKKLWINPTKGMGICYRCGYSGSLIYIVKTLMGTSLANAIRIVKGKTPEGLMNFKLLMPQFTDQSITELKTIELPYGYEPIVGPHPYLEERGIPWQYAVQNGWGTCDAGYLKDRIIVPFYIGEKLVFWQARATWESKDKDFKKVLNPKGVSARHVLYNFNKARKFEEIVLVEGFVDACKVGPNAVATNGKALHHEQAMLLLQTEAKTITILWDKDAWEDGRIRNGKETQPSAIKAINVLRSVKGWKIKYIKELPKKDPGSFKFGSKLLKSLIAEAKEF